MQQAVHDHIHVSIITDRPQLPTRTATHKSADGSCGAERLTTAEEAFGAGISWSPDGEILAFTRGNHMAIKKMYSS